MSEQKVPKNIMMAKALGFTNSISKLSREERAKNPSGSFGSDYNSLRDNISISYPQLAALLPPSVDIERGSSGSFTRQNYGEIFTFAEQIYQMLDSVEEG